MQEKGFNVIINYEGSKNINSLDIQEAIENMLQIMADEEIIENCKVRVWLKSWYANN